jgi:hypothetical protein
VSKLLASLVAIAALAAPAFAAEPAVTARGVGAVTLGALYATLHARRLVGPIGPGCEVAGPNARSAQLRPPLQGSVDFTMTEPRRVATITIRGGAAARGIGVGASETALRRAFPSARFDHATDTLFGATFVRVGRQAGGPFAFALDTKTKRVDLIAVPDVATCE